MRGLKVLSIGLSDLAVLVKDALMLRSHSKLAVASDYCDPCSLPSHRGGFEVAALDQPNPARELRRNSSIAPPEHTSAHRIKRMAAPRMNDVMTEQAKTASEIVVCCLLLALALLIFCTTVPM